MPERNAFADRCYRSWEAKHGRPPSWGKVEFIALAAIAKRLGPLSDLAWDAYLAVEDDFYRSHNPKRMLADLDAFVPAPSEATAPQWPERKCEGVYDCFLGKRRPCENPPAPGANLCSECIREIKSWLAERRAASRPG